MAEEHAAPTPPKATEADQKNLMEVTSFRGWAALSAVGAALVALIVWSVLGSIPERIEGQGIIVRGGGLREVRASGGGNLTQFAIKIGETVSEGQIVGEITQVGSSEDIKEKRQAYETAQREYETSKAEEEATIAGFKAQISGADADKRGVQLLLQKAREDLARKQEALSKGLVTQRSVEQAQRDVANYETQISGKDAQIAGLNAQIRQVQQRIRAKEDNVARTRREFERVNNTTSSLAQITSTVRGRVVEVKHRVGDLVKEGEVVATVEPPGAGIDPVVYINSGNGKRIKPGMEAHVMPSTVRTDDYGYMQAKVQVVGEYPVTPEAVRAVTGNAQQVQELLAGTSKIEVHATLQPDPRAPSGYKWSTSTGPPFQIDGGTRITIAVVVSRKPPISYVLPIFKATQGG